MTDAEMIAAAQAKALEAEVRWGIRWTEQDFVAWLWESSDFGLARKEAERLGRRACTGAT